MKLVQQIQWPHTKYGINCHIVNRYFLITEIELSMILIKLRWQTFNS